MAYTNSAAAVIAERTNDPTPDTEAPAEAAADSAEGDGGEEIARAG